VPDDVLQQQLDDYAQDYSFGERTGGGGGFRGDPVKTAAMNYAREIIRTKAKEKGMELEAPQVTKAAQQLLDMQGENGKLMQLAKAAVEAEKAAAQEALASATEILDQQQAQPQEQAAE